VLWRVTFQLLIDPNGSLVIDRFAIFYTPSVAMLATATARYALALRRDRRYAHPFYWAPFVVVGAP